jgi:hypothetical protein
MHGCWKIVRANFHENAGLLRWCRCVRTRCAVKLRCKPYPSPKHLVERKRGLEDMESQPPLQPTRGKRLIRTPKAKVVALRARRFFLRGPCPCALNDLLCFCNVEQGSLRTRHQPHCGWNCTPGVGRSSLRNLRACMKVWDSRLVENRSGGGDSGGCGADNCKSGNKEFGL